MILRLGIEEDNITTQIFHTFLRLGIAVYLGFQGFVLLSVIFSAFNLISLVLIGLCWIAFRIKLPLNLPKLPRRKASQSPVILARLLVITIALVPFDAIRLVWPIQSADIMLGLLLAALSTLWAISIIIIGPPTTTSSLRELRSELAFGEIDVEEARIKALHALKGTPDEHFLTSKADEAATELKQASLLFKSLTKQMQRMIPLAEQLKLAKPNEATVHAISKEFRTLLKAIKGNTEAVTAHKERAVDLRIQLNSRVEAAQFLLNLDPEVGKAILLRLDELLQEAETSRKEFAKVGFNEENKLAFDFLCSVQRDVKIPPNQTLYQLIRTCFTE